MIEKTDQELIYDSSKGDDDAFKELLGRHLKHTYNFIYHLTGNIEELQNENKKESEPNVLNNNSTLTMLEKVFNHDMFVQYNELFSNLI